jgi:ubiquinone/menaquinone biosynthesis C-methylase UbiE
VKKTTLNAEQAVETGALAALTTESILAMSYNELIALVRETNRFPGGRRSVLQIVQRLMLNRDSRLLEIGCATGSTSIEISRIVGCRPTAIDINPDSITEAKRRAEEVEANVDFIVADATQLPMLDGAFDVTICGNVTALVDDKSAAVSEYIRVLREGGILVAAPLYYVRPPPDELVDQVREAIQVNIPILYRKDALEFFYGIGLEVYDELDFEFDHIQEEIVETFCHHILNREHLKALNSAAKQTLDERYREYMMLFRENMEYLGFTILFLRKTRFIEDPELFTAFPAWTRPT